MKTPNLDRVLDGFVTIGDDAKEAIRAAVASDIRAACEGAWGDGYIDGCGPADCANPYARKATP